MSTSKRPRDEDAGAAPEASAAGPETKKPRHGFRVGPENLPDGPWRRKVTKIKKDLIHKAKVKKAFAKVKAAEEQEKTAKEEEADVVDGGEEAEEEEPEPQIHPERQAMLDEQEQRQNDRESRPEGEDGEHEPQEHRHRRQRVDRRDRRRPGYYDKALEQAEKRKQEAEARAAEAKRRAEERERKIAQRERIRRAMAKARPGNRTGGKRKLGRESGVLLEKVKQLVNQ